MMRMVDPERHAARRTQILEGAATAFAQKGYDNTTVKHVYTAAGVGSGTLFHYFADKRAIFHGVLEADATPCWPTSRPSTSPMPVRECGRSSTDDLDIRVLDRDTGALIRKLILDPTRDYQPRGVKCGNSPENRL